MLRSLLIVDDHPVYLDGLRRVLLTSLSRTVIATANDFASAIAALDAGQPIDLCLTDERLPDRSGLDFIVEARRRRPAPAVALLCSDVTPALSARVRRAGAIACLSKERDCASIVAAVETLFDGEEIFDGAASVAVMLSDRRQEIVRMAADGMSDKQISHHLSITESGVRNHWLYIFDQLGVLNRTEAVTKALRSRII